MVCNATGDQTSNISSVTQYKWICKAAQLLLRTWCLYCRYCRRFHFRIALLWTCGLKTHWWLEHIKWTPGAHLLVWFYSKGVQLAFWNSCQVINHSTVSVQMIRRFTSKIHCSSELQCYCRGILSVQVLLDLSVLSSQRQVTLCRAPEHDWLHTHAHPCVLWSASDRKSLGLSKP